MGDDNDEGNSSRLFAKRYFIIIAALLVIAGLLMLMDLIQLSQVRLIFGAMAQLERKTFIV